MTVGSSAGSSAAQGSGGRTGPQVGERTRPERCQPAADQLHTGDVSRPLGHPTGQPCFHRHPSMLAADPGASGAATGDPAFGGEEVEHAGGDALHALPLVPSPNRICSRRAGTYSESSPPYAWPRAESACTVASSTRRSQPPDAWRGPAPELNLLA